MTVQAPAAPLTVAPVCAKRDEGRRTNAGPRDDPKGLSSTSEIPSAVEYPDHEHEDEYHEIAVGSRPMKVRLKGGWLKLWRAVFSNPALAPRPTEQARSMEAWLWLLAICNHADNPSHDPPLNAGECLVSRGTICDYTGWTSSRARSWWALLEREGMIATESIGRATKITVLNWWKYQGEGAQTAPRQRQTSAQPSGENRNENGAGTPDAGQTDAKGGTASTEEGRRKKEEEEIVADATLVVDGIEWPHPDRVGRGKGRKPYPANFDSGWARIRQAAATADSGNEGHKGDCYKAMYATLKIEAATFRDLGRAYLSHCKERSSPGSHSIKSAGAFFGPRQHWAKYVAEASPSQSSLLAERLRFRDLTDDQQLNVRSNYQTITDDTSTGIHTVEWWESLTPDQQRRTSDSALRRGANL